MEEKTAMTVGEFIEVLQKFDKNNIITITEVDGDVITHRSIKLINNYLIADYVDDLGEFKTDNILSIF
ncbi:MAG: hypothetical protein ACOC22_01605 [bacterium]